MTQTAKQHEVLLRLPTVLKRFPVSRSAWYSGVKSGIYPQGVKIGDRSRAWTESSINALIQSVSE